MKTKTLTFVNVFYHRFVLRRERFLMTFLLMKLPPVLVEDRLR